MFSVKEDSVKPYLIFFPNWYEVDEAKICFVFIFWKSIFFIQFSHDIFKQWNTFLLENLKLKILPDFVIWYEVFIFQHDESESYDVDVDISHMIIFSKDYIKSQKYLIKHWSSLKWKNKNRINICLHKRIKMSWYVALRPLTWIRHKTRVFNGMFQKTL